MADRYTSRIALVLDAPVDDVGELVRAAGHVGDLDRASAVRGEGEDAQEVHWGGRMQKAVVRAATADDGASLLRTETYLGGDGVVEGMRRQTQLLRGLARHLPGRVTGVRDLSAITERDQAWINRLAIGTVGGAGAVVAGPHGGGTWGLPPHGAARSDVPDLELYGPSRAQAPAAEAAVREAHDQLLRRGLKGELDLADGTSIYLVPVLEAWGQVPLDWPGVGKAGQDRGAGLDGPRATLSVKHRPRLGRYKKDLDGVIAALPAEA